MPDKALVVINLDIMASVTTILGALPEIVALHPRMMALPELDVEAVRKLELYALALGHAHTLLAASSAPTEPIEQIAEAATALREVLLSDASALATRGLIDGQRLRELKGSNGYRNCALDLLMLATVLRESWPAAAGKTAVELAELDKAETLADHLLRAIGLREQAPTAAAVTALRSCVTSSRTAWRRWDWPDLATGRGAAGPRLPAGTAAIRIAMQVPRRRR